MERINSKRLDGTPGQHAREQARQARGIPGEDPTVPCGPVRVHDTSVRLLKRTADGIIGYAVCILDFGGGADLYLNDIAIKMTEDKGLFLEYPSTTNPRGVRYRTWRPMSAAAHALIEADVFRVVNQMRDAMV